MGCCQPVLGPIENYYTKYAIDKMLEEIESGITSGCCITPEEVDEKIDEAISGISPDLSDYYTKEEVDALIPEVPSLSGYATEQWVLDKHYISGVDLSDYALKSEIPTVPTSNTAFTNDAGYLTEHQSLSGYATEQWVEDKHYITGVDLSDYVTYESLPDLSVYATKQWVINQNFALNTELIQYITNLQNQIDSLKQQISGCCGSTGETITRWITMTSENDYTCSGTTKMTKEKEQTSTDGGNTWADTGNYRTGSTVLEVNSVDCGFMPTLKYTATYTDSSVVTANCDGNSTIVVGEIEKTNLESLVVGNCVTVIDSCTFCTAYELKNLRISSGVTTIKSDAFYGCNDLSSVTFDNGSQLTTIGKSAFEGCSMREISLPNALKTIGDEVFDECYHLDSLTIPSGVTSIGKMAFWGVGMQSTGFTGFTILATVPPRLGENAFNYTNDAPIYVPAQSVDAYKAANGWTQYASRIQAIP